MGKVGGGWPGGEMAEEVREGKECPLVGVGCGGAGGGDGKEDRDSQSWSSAGCLAL